MTKQREDLNLAAYDAIVVSTSGGKDSITALALVATEAKLLGILDRVVAVHADLGDLEHAGTTDLVRRQCDRLGVRLEIVRYINKDGEALDIIEHAIKIGRTPGLGMQGQFCTSDHKRGPIRRVYTTMAAASRKRTGHAVASVLSVQGIRKDESKIRSKRQPVQLDSDCTSGVKVVTTYYPIFTWTEAEVWEFIQANGLETHECYSRLPRHSCQLCIFSQQWSMVQEVARVPELAARYAAAEKVIGRNFHASNKPMQWFIDQAAAGVVLEETEDDGCDWCGGF